MHNQFFFYLDQYKLQILKCNFSYLLLLLDSLLIFLVILLLSCVSCFSAQDATYFADRVVTITGPLDNCRQALELIFDKMRKCAELDQQNFPVSA